jgi:hypothetical protein
MSSNQCDTPSCLYIGSYNDFEPIERLPFINTWIFVDSMPYYEGENEEIFLTPSDDEENPERWLNDKEYRKEKILAEWKNTFKNFGDLISDEDNLMTYKRDDKTLYFFYNAPYPSLQSETFKSLSNNVKYLYIQRYIPHRQVLTLPNLDTLLVGDDCYLLPNNDDDAISFLYQNFVERFKYVYVEKTYEKESDLVYMFNLLHIHQYSLTTKSWKNHIEYVESVDREEGMKMNRHYTQYEHLMV